MSDRRELVTNSIVPRIKAVLTAAEQTAAQVAEEAESEASRRASELLAGADADADRIRREATRRVEEYLAASRRRIDAFATARIERITELTEGVIEASASIKERFEQAAAIQREVHAMVEALGAVAEAVAREAAVASPSLPRAPEGPARKTAPGWARTGPDGSVIGETSNGRAGSSDGDHDAGGDPQAHEDGLAGELSELDEDGALQDAGGHPLDELRGAEAEDGLAELDDEGRARSDEAEQIDLDDSGMTAS